MFYSKWSPGLCRLLLPAGGLDNCCQWVFCTNKVSAVWDFWLSSAANPKETAATAWLLEKGHSVNVAGMSGRKCAHRHTYV